MNNKLHSSIRLSFLLASLSFILMDCSKDDGKFVDYNELSKTCDNIGESRPDNSQIPDSKLVLLIEGEPHKWNELLPPAIIPLETAEVDIVGCLTLSNTTIEGCKYGNSGEFTLARTVSTITIDLVNINSNHLLASKSFFGQEPTECPDTYLFGSSSYLYINGPEVKYSEGVEAFLLTGF